MNRAEGYSVQHGKLPPPPRHGNGSSGSTYPLGDLTDAQDYLMIHAEEGESMKKLSRRVLAAVAAFRKHHPDRKFITRTDPIERSITIWRNLY